MWPLVQQTRVLAENALAKMATRYEVQPTKGMQTQAEMQAEQTVGFDALPHLANRRMLTVNSLSALSATWLLVACTAAACTALTPTTAAARDGTNLATGALVSIDDGARLKTGHQVDVFDFTTGQSVSVQIEQISERPAGLQIRVLDPQTGRSHTLLMER